MPYIAIKEREPGVENIIQKQQIDNFRKVIRKYYYLSLYIIIIFPHYSNLVMSGMIRNSIMANPTKSKVDI